MTDSKIEPKELTLENLQEVILKEVDPILDLHGGSCKILELDTDSKQITLSLRGACTGCPSASITLYNGIVPIIQEHFPEVEVLLG